MSHVDLERVSVHIVNKTRRDMASFWEAGVGYRAVGSPLQSTEGQGARGAQMRRNSLKKERAGKGPGGDGLSVTSHAA